MFTMGPPLWGGGASDPFDPMVTLLMRFNSNLTDEKGHAFTASGAVSYVNPDWLGGQAISMNGFAVNLTTASTDFDFQGDFCLEAAVNVLSISGGTDYLFDIRQAGTAIFSIYFTGGAVGTLMRDGVGSNTNSSGPAVSLGTPFHVALVREGTGFRSYVNGVQFGTKSIAYFSPAAPCNLSIGSGSNAQIAWARITKGNCRYTGTPFTPPAVEP